VPPGPAGWAAASAPGSAGRAAPAGASADPPPTRLEDDFERSVAEAGRSKRLVLVEVWARWCAPCSSLRADALAGLEHRWASRFVVVTLDTDRPSSAPFLEKYGHRVLPTLLVVRPDDRAVVGLRTGATSKSELDAWLNELEREPDEARRALMDAHVRQAKDETAAAAAIFREVAPRATPSAREEATIAALDAFAGLDDPVSCVAVGRENLPSLRGAGARVDASLAVLRCAAGLSEEDQEGAREVVSAALAPFAADAGVDAPPYIHAEALALLSEIHAARGEVERVRAVDDRRLSLLERAAAEASGPDHAQTFDHARVKLYVALGRAEEGVALLKARTEQPDAGYETHGRLGTTLLELGRAREAIPPLERAVQRAYGAPKLVYMARLAAALETTGESSRARKLVEEEVAGWEALPAGQRDPTRHADALRRLERLRGGAR
jgi:thiol-disulfide isomerase/thioredoxin